MAALVDGLLVLAAMLFVKHLAADGPLQTRYHLLNKGRLLHPGGLAHAGVHVGLSAVCLALWFVSFAPAGFALQHAIIAFLLLLAIEFVLHYTIDYTKCRLDAHLQLSTTEVDDLGQRRTTIHGSAFFIAFLSDQTAHSLTYIGMLAVLHQFVTA